MLTLRILFAWLLIAASCTAQGVSLLDLDPAIVADGSDQTERIREALQRAIGKRVTIPAGIYGVSGNILTLGFEQPMQLQGEGIGITAFKLLRDSKEPIIHIQGSTVAVKAGEDKRQIATWFKCSDIEFYGDNRAATWVRFDSAAHCYFSDCLFRHTKGPAVSGQQWWDTTFTCCHFVGCGTKDQAAVVLERATAPQWPWLWCNNIVFTTCRWESCPNVGLDIGGRSQAIRVIGCKIDRVPGVIKNDGTQTQLIGNEVINKKP